MNDPAPPVATRSFTNPRLRSTSRPRSSQYLISLTRDRNARVQDYTPLDLMDTWTVFSFLGLAPVCLVMVAESGGEEGGVTVFGKASGWDVGVDDKELLGLLLRRDEIVALCMSILRTASEL